jgi:hypothetical protein
MDKLNRSNIKKLFPDQRWENLEIAINLAIETTIDGMWCEFGVGNGDSIKFIANRNPNNVIYGFDSFQGLPETWFPGLIEIGEYACAAPTDLPTNIQIIEGLFSDTLPLFKKEKLSFIHIDCDLYSSTKTVFDNFKDYIDTGTVIVFDELIHYPTYENHEYKAFCEFLEETGKHHEVVSMSERMSFVTIKII